MASMHSLSAIPGKDKTLPALALVHHMDVVPIIDADSWDYPPFGGIVADGHLHGRGTQDMKSVGAIHYQALRKCAQLGIQPQRTIYLIAVPDEEIGGFTGTKLLLQSPLFAHLAIGYVLDEGLASGNPAAVFIKTSERKPLQVRISATGKAAHGSHLFADNPIHKLVQVCASLVQEQQQRQATATTLSSLGQVLSANITSLHAGNTATYNAVPAEAEAIIDIRVPHAMPAETARNIVEHAVYAVPGASYEIVACVADYPLIDQEQTILFAALAKACTFHGIEPIAYHAEEASDLRFYWQHGLQGLGFSPFTCKEALHATNESLPLIDLIRGYEIICTFLSQFCY